MVGIFSFFNYGVVGGVVCGGTVLLVLMNVVDKPVDRFYFYLFSAFFLLAWPHISDGLPGKG